MKFTDKVLLGILVAAGIGATTAAVIAYFPAQPSHQVTATVISVTPIGAKFPAADVTARTASGITSEMIVKWDDFRCHVGDEVSGTQTGVRLVLDRSSCRPPAQTSSTSRP